ncbi:MAG: GNAT family N-acetyltransferase [Chitinophagales bacterium]|nr:GNAT family N-acetyltransferase [Bacteroidota bacterium]
MKNSIVQLHPQNQHLLELFLQKMGNSKHSFRYFESRSLDILQQHVITLLYVEDDEPIAYGHLDKEDDIVWLGIAVAENQKGKGLGNKIMQALIENAKQLYVEKIRLSVDKDNAIAIKLYEKFGFKMISENQKSYFMEKQIEI